MDERAQAGALRAGLIRRPLQEQPARLGQERLSPAFAERAHFGAADLIDRVAHVLRDVEAVEDVERVAGLLRDDRQIGLPHVTADKQEHGGPFFAEPAKEPEQCLGASVLTDPQQPLARRVDVIDGVRNWLPRCQWISSMPIARIPVRSTRSRPQPTAMATDRNT